MVLKGLNIPLFIVPTRKGYRAYKFNWEAYLKRESRALEESFYSIFATVNLVDEEFRTLEAIKR